MLRIAPHIIWPLEFVLPHEKHLRPAWMVRAGLFLYDHIGGRTSLPRSRASGSTQVTAPAEARVRRGFTYYDAWVTTRAWWC
jgi:glycerol-3-phosphate dehydrogenase